VKELRLNGVATDDAANTFLATTYLARFNAQFSVAPVATVNLHRPLTADEKKHLASIFSRQTARTVQNDFSFSFNNRWYQLTATQSIVVRKKDIVTVEEHLDTTIHVRLRDKELNYTILPARPKKARQTIPWVLAPTPSSVPHKPSPHHPWRQPFLMKTRQNTPRVQGEGGG
jgi:hypothetical protein